MRLLLDIQVEHVSGPSCDPSAIAEALLDEIADLGFTVTPPLEEHVNFRSFYKVEGGRWSR
jgi:hypothetical protein